MTQRLWLGFLWLAGASIALAQVRAPAQESAFGPHPLTSREGEAIVSAAWERERQGRSSPDCSHLVHEVYAIAGLPYPYADSFDLYAGMERFVRVTKPQPGDLVVWRGHVGIVVDPAEHSFYSSVRSGLRTEFYDAPFWKARGPARFYRYVTATPVNFTLAEERRAQISNEPAQVVTVPIIEDSPKIPPGSMQTTKSPETITPAVPALQLPSTRSAVQIPSSILVAASQEKPTQAEIAGAVSELNNAAGSILREENFLQLSRQVIIYDNLIVDHTDTKNKRGSAQARIESCVTLQGEHLEGKRHSEKVRWELLRRSDGWEVRAPKDRTYVPRDVAIRMLAARLASLTQQAGASRSGSIHQQAQIVRVLSALLEERM